MIRHRARLALGLAAALVVGGTAVVVNATTASAAGGVSATFVKTSDWGSGYNGQYTITNNSTADVNGWNLQFDIAGGSISSLWKGKITPSGNHYPVVNEGLKKGIPPGGVLPDGVRDTVEEAPGTPAG